ncbi:MAG: phosphotransferase [Sarcina sp.]
MIGKKVSVLKLLNKNSGFSQRMISNELGISLGKINAIIKDLENEGFLEIELLEKGLRYKVTKRGFELLKLEVKEFKDIRLNIHTDEIKKEIKECIILAAGNKEEFDMPASFLELDGLRVIDRQVQILKDNGIEKIIIVTGYKKEYYDEFAKNYQNVICVYNENYKWTGSMSSLSIAKEYINGDFILIENDLVFESNAIERILKSKYRDSVLITNESGSGDEAFIEIRDGFIYKMSKDIHQFNKIDGEMIGISKISKKLYELMCDEFITNLNPYMNYEYTMLDVARNYDVGYEKFIDLVWGEIDDVRQYNKIIKNILPRIRRKEIIDKVEKVKEILTVGLNVRSEIIEKVAPIGGMTNKNYSAKVNEQEYVIRIPGTGTSEMMDRVSEGRNSKLVADIGIDADILYYDDRTGTKISVMIEGAETVNAAMAKKESMMKKTTEILRTLHNSKIDMKNTFDVFENINLYEELVEKCDARYYENYYLIRKEVMCLKDILRENGMHLVPSHNDTVPENFIKDSKGKLYLIDWEYGGLNDPMWDLAAHSVECGFTIEEEELLLKIYFESEVKKEDKIRVLCYKIAQDFLWAIWTIIKEAKGDDFGTYGIDRFNRCKKLLKVLKSEYAFA